MCLIYYFKIPIIEEKWIETLRTHDKDKGIFKLQSKDRMTERTSRKKDRGEDEFSKSKDKEKGINLTELKENIIPDIITMLTELFWQVKNYLVKSNKITKN